MSEKVELDGDGVPLEAEGFSEKEKAANRPGETETNTVLEAAIDKATGYDGTGTEKPDPETEKPETGTKKRDYVEEAVQCFIKDVKDLDPTDPIKAVEDYFRKNATDELKARCKAEGKDAKGCWKFIEAVARKALGNRAGHIDPSAIYAIAMHWFEDVPADWDAASAKAPARQASKKPTTRKERLEERVSHGSTKAKAELRELKKKERAKAKAKAKKPKQQQGFFFEMLETPEQESEVQE